MRTPKLAVLTLVAVGLAAAAVSTGVATAGTTTAGASAAGVSKTYAYDFSSSDQGWIADVSDYKPAQANSLELESGIRPLPEGTAPGNGFYMHGHNRSDDLFMFLKRRLGPEDGIVAGRRYAVQSTVSLWSNEPDCIGSGGGGGGAEFLKAGASTAEPTIFLSDRGRYEVTLNKGEQARSGTESTKIGTAANGRDCGDYTWTLVTHTSSTTLTVQADATGHLWLNAGTDSGYEGINQFYYSSIATTLTEL